MPCSAPWNEQPRVDTHPAALLSEAFLVGLKERDNTPPRPFPLAVHIICFMSAQSLSVRLFTSAVSLPSPPKKKQRADAASEGLNESNPDQISWGFFFVLHLLTQHILFFICCLIDVIGQDKFTSWTIKFTVTLTLTCSSMRGSHNLNLHSLKKSNLKWPIHLGVNSLTT